MARNSLRDIARSILMTPPLEPRVVVDTVFSEAGYLSNTASEPFAAARVLEGTLEKLVVVIVVGLAWHRGSIGQMEPVAPFADVLRARTHLEQVALLEGGRRPLEVHVAFGFTFLPGGIRPKVRDSDFLGTRRAVVQEIVRSPQASTTSRFSSRT